MQWIKASRLCQIGFLIFTLMETAWIGASHSTPTDNLSAVCNKSFIKRTSELSSEYWFSIPCYPIVHQGNKILLNISVAYSFDAVGKPDRDHQHYLTQKIHKFLSNYWNNSDFWEIVNRRLVNYLYSNNPDLSFLGIEIEVVPYPVLPYYSRASTVAVIGDGYRKEMWEFQFPYGAADMSDRLSIIKVHYTYKPNLQTNDYVDFLVMRRTIENFLATNKLDVARRNHRQKLNRKILAEYPQIQEVSVTSSKP